MRMWFPITSDRAFSRSSPFGSPSPCLITPWTSVSRVIPARCIIALLPTPMCRLVWNTKIGRDSDTESSISPVIASPPAMLGSHPMHTRISFGSASAACAWVTLASAARTSAQPVCTAPVTALRSYDPTHGCDASAASPKMWQWASTNPGTTTLSMNESSTCGSCPARSDMTSANVPEWRTRPSDTATASAWGIAESSVRKRLARKTVGRPFTWSPPGTRRAAASCRACLSRAAGAPRGSRPSSGT